MWDLEKIAAVCILRSVWRAGVQWGPASIPAVSLELVAGLTWMDGGALGRQHLSAGLTRHRYFPQPPGLQGEKPNHLSQYHRVPGGDGSPSGVAAFRLLGANKQMFAWGAPIHW